MKDITNVAKINEFFAQNGQIEYPKWVELSKEHFSESFKKECQHLIDTFESAAAKKDRKKAEAAKNKVSQAAAAPALVFRGIYDSQATYYGDNYRVDAVKYDGQYYIARIDAGTFSAIAPPDTNKWNSFGATFDSVATNLLLAEGASSGDIIELDAQNNRIYIESAT